jgi:lysophospholipase L1-like esterase
MKENNMPLANEEKTIAFLGDSITADMRHNYISMFLHKLSEHINIENISIINSGVDSSSIFDATDRVPELFDENSNIDILVVFIGVNDSKIFYGIDKPLVSPALYREKYCDLIKLVKSKNPDIKIILMTLPCLLFDKIKNGNFLSNYWYWDVNEYEAYNGIIRDICCDFNLVLANIFDAFSKKAESLSELFTSDGVHPNSKGHLLISEKLFEVFIAEALI